VSEITCGTKRTAVSCHPVVKCRRRRGPVDDSTIVDGRHRVVTVGLAVRISAPQYKNRTCHELTFIKKGLLGKQAEIDSGIIFKRDNAKISNRENLVKLRVSMEE